MIKMVKKNILSIITALIILYLSLARAETFNKVNVLGLKHIDKVVHTSMYFGLMIVLLYENRSALKNIRNFFVLAIIPLVYGILMEFLQSWLTVSRKGDFFDAIFNLIGISLALMVWWWFQNVRKKEN
jgi:VanZ family protein